RRRDRSACLALIGLVARNDGIGYIPGGSTPPRAAPEALIAAARRTLAEIARYHRIDGRRTDAELDQAVLVADAFLLQGPVIVAAERLARHELQRARLQPRQRIAQLPDVPAQSQLARGVADQF